MNDGRNSHPRVFDIKRYAINDGPGIRIVIFLKGCNLSCLWCHNPESISVRNERMYARSKCIRCGVCVETCPAGAITASQEAMVTDPTACELCGTCADACATKAVEMSGSEMSVDEIMREIEKEQVFFDQSGGGVTFSGGEPLVHHQFLIRLLDECGRRRIHRAVDTAGFVNTDILLEVARRTDLFLYDLKLMDSDRHRQWTGVPNEKILENLQILAKTGACINIRIPLIGGVNDDDDNILASARFVSSLAGEPKTVNLLPYHKIAQVKYEKLGRPESFQLFLEPTMETQDRARTIFQRCGIKVTVGG